MFFFSNICFMCLNNYKNLQTTLIEDNEGIVIQKKLKYCLPEIVESHKEIPQYLCSNCMSKLDCFYKFKQWCLQNNKILKNYLNTLAPTEETHKHLSVRLTDIKNQNNLHVESKDQTLPIKGCDDELRTGRKEDSWTEEDKAVFNINIQCADVLDINDPHLLFDETKDIIAKEECVTSSDESTDNKFYHETENSDCILIPSDSEVSEKDDSSESSSTEPEESNVKLQNVIKKTNKFECTICSKVYTQKQSLIYHLKIHSGIKNFICSTCNKKFVTRSLLMTHEKSHSTIKNFECIICKERFAHCSDLMRHKKVHLIFKNFECLVCKRKFMYQSFLDRHAKLCGH